MGGGAGLVCAGVGLPVVFGGGARVRQAARECSCPPSIRYPRRCPARTGWEARELLLLAEEVRLAEFDPTDRGARVGADERLVRRGGTVLAVWDGSLSDGGDATAHLVAYARARVIPVDVVRPEGAAPTEPRTA
ncbi:hypothetical protein [Streptomyces sp. SLBN-31]|uniref:hypothetical protein n=1 Tax=Streptomyces sp. SLBN-31 TaxID=2768444 RepID=UPI0011522C34|nr:hypothetical protein [Streptomyces sp. SLBN-31]